MSRGLKKARRPLALAKPQGRREPVFKLIREQNKLYSYVVEYALNKGVNALSLLTEASFSKLYTDTFTKSRTGAYHKHLFSAYSALIVSYEIALNLWEENISEVQNERNRTILSGINSVVISRLNEYKDNDYHLYYEKRIKSVDEYLYGFFEDTNILIKGSLKKNLHLLAHCGKEKLWGITKENLSESIEEIKDFIISQYSTSIFDIYEKRLIEAVTCFDGDMNHYLEEKFFQSLKDEMGILANLITVQIPELENESDQLVIQKYLSILRGAYQNLGRDIQITENLHNNTVFFDFEKENFYVFLKEINNFIDKKTDFFSDFDDFYKGYENLKEIFQNCFKDVLNDLASEKIQRLSCADSAKIAVETVEKCEKMVILIIEKFDEIIKYPSFDENNFQQNDNGYLIIKGILETVEIKIESLNEAFDEYSKNISAISAVKISSTDIFNQLKENMIQEFLAKYKENFADYIGISRGSIKEIMSFLGKSAFAISAKTQEQFNKINAANLEKLASADFRFKRESLLFEISTFEEILNYSVSKLLESPVSEVKTFAEMVYESGEKIAQILAFYNIEIIDPKPHEIFNGKIHEVLMANPSEGFNKGEIIKVMNKGYKINDTIYIRANVICAK